MKRYISNPIIILFIFILSSCNQDQAIDSETLNEYDVVNTVAEAQEGDFVFRIMSEKEEYQTTEDVEVYGEIEYSGEKDEITIYHAASAITFPIKEKIRGYYIDSFIQEIGMSTTLKRGVPYRQKYTKSNSDRNDESPKEYVTFIQDFIDKKGFPIGYYFVSGDAVFAADTDGNNERRERFNLKFKVKD